MGLKKHFTRKNRLKTKKKNWFKKAEFHQKLFPRLAYFSRFLSLSLKKHDMNRKHSLLSAFQFIQPFDLLI